MKEIPLITSLPPVISRVDDTGVDVGSDWLDICIRSWLQHGFRPVTVNSRKETLPDFDLLTEFSQLKVEKDGFDEFGKRYVALNDMMDCVLRHHDGPIAITNSDIALNLSDAAKDRIETLQAGSCFVCNRIDVEKPDMENGVLYPTGFDFFVFHADDLRKMSANGMYFGLPWWDHFLPINMLAQGVKRLPSDGINAYHLNHSGRWKRRLWRSLGLRYVRDMQALGAACDSAFLADLATAVKRKRKSRNKIIARIVPAAFRKTDFYAIGDLDVAYIDNARENARG